MDEQNKLDSEEISEETPKEHLKQTKRRNRQKNLIFALILVAAILLTSICTFSVTYRNLQSRYASDVGESNRENAELQRQVEKLTEALEEAKKEAEISKPTSSTFSQLELLNKLFQVYSYYAGDVSLEELETAVMKAYAEATGDKYAEYYTAEEYAALTEDSAGNFEGIGVSVLNDQVEVNSVKYSAFFVLTIYESSHALEAGLLPGDYIYAVKVDDHYQTIDALGGYTKGISAIRGLKGTYVEILAFRKNGDIYEAIEMQIMRDSFVSQSVTAKVSETNKKIGIVRISEFDLTTPGQLKSAITELQKKGVSKFVFDLRNNPGGDLRSIRATLSYFLNKDDLILATIDRNGRVDKSYTVGVLTAGPDDGTCSVDEDEIGMYHDLNMVVLCNGNTASAAEVFVAGIQDYGLATIVGDVTYGKGIMQSYIPLSYFGSQFSGYAKMTTYAYVTHRGETYHEIGIVPDLEVALTEEAAGYSIYLRPESVDNQLQTAIAQLK
ncbi:MAG: hypothetical protein IJR88_03775 [Clostridia bacterium]|nr:hypothetical protein [Clostridia bacterium]